MCLRGQKQDFLLNMFFFGENMFLVKIEFFGEKMALVNHGF